MTQMEACEVYQNDPGHHGSARAQDGPVRLWIHGEPMGESGVPDYGPLEGRVESTQPYGA